MTWFDEVARQVKRVDSYTAQLLLRERYETQYRIFDHDSDHLQKLYPMALVAMHSKEDAFSYSLLHRLMWRFRLYGIHKEWGCDFKTFMELPWYQTQAIFAIEQRMAQQQLREEEARQRAEERSMKGMQQDYGSAFIRQYQSAGTKK